MSRVEAYPLTVGWLLLGLVCGSFIGVTTDNLAAALAVSVLLVAVGLVWRRDDPPVLPFIVTYQWVSVTAGYWYERVFGTFPGMYRPGDVEHTMILGLAGLLVLAVGARLAAQFLGGPAADDRETGAAILGAGLTRPLFLVVMAAYSIEYVYTVNPREFGAMASFVQRLLEFRQVLLVTLWLQLLLTRKHMVLLVISLVWAVVPRLGSYYADFKSPIVLMLISLAAVWKPWEIGWSRRTVIASLKATPFVAVLLVVLLVWQGGLKKNTRAAYDDGVIGRDASERVSFFVQNFRRDLPLLFEDPEPFVEALVERVSYITFFSRVLDHVPSHEPYASGELLRMAMLNAFVPRILVPEKPELPSDSYYTRRFTGIQVAETGTSVSIGYMAEFYADWGLRGMYLSILGFGFWIGLVGVVVRRLAAVPAMRFAALTVVLLAVADFEQQFIKGFAALNLSAGVTVFLMFALRPWLLRLTGTHSRTPAPAIRPEATEASVR